MIVFVSVCYERVCPANSVAKKHNSIRNWISLVQLAEDADGSITVDMYSTYLHYKRLFEPHKPPVGHVYITSTGSKTIS